MQRTNLITLNVLLVFVVVLLGTSIASLTTGGMGSAATTTVAAEQPQEGDEDGAIVAEEADAEMLAAGFDPIKRKKGKIYEGQRGFSCAVNGNRICGPKNKQGAAAGCYRDGKLVIPWTRYDVPSKDPLYRQFTPPC